MPRTACIVAAGTFGESYCLLKNRDRNYVPEIHLVHEVKDGVEVAYLEDEFTGWIEGLNEFGIGIANAALMVSRDETERDAVERTGKKLGDGDRILKALVQETVAKAAKSVREYKGGLKGHTIISDGKKSFYVEMPDSDEMEYDDLPLDKLFVRTNHGVEFSDAGYVEGDREKSSKSRQEEAEEVLADVDSVDDIAPALLKAREERWEPTEMVRDGRSPENMRTTTQMVLDLTQKKLILYLLPDKVKWLGLDDRMPEGRKAKIEVQVREYTDLSVKTDGDTKVVKKGSEGLLPILDPAFNVREMFKQLVLLEDHLFHPRKRCPDCIWKHLFTTEALAEEAVTLDVNQQYASLLGGLADQIRRVQRAVQERLPYEFIAQRVRELRKGLLPVASRVRVAGEKRASYFNVGDYVSYGKFQNKPGKLVRIFTDERGIPMIEIEPVPKGRKKNRVMGLFRVRHVTPPETKVAARWLARTASTTPEELALEFLTDLGIHAHLKHGVLLVDRTSMVEFSPRLEESRAYEAVLTGLKNEFPDYRLYWGGRTDDWMGVKFHPKAGRAAGERVGAFFEQDHFWKRNLGWVKEIQKSLAEVLDPNVYRVEIKDHWTGPSLDVIVTPVVRGPEARLTFYSNNPIKLDVPATDSVLMRALQAEKQKYDRLLDEDRERLARRDERRSSVQILLDKVSGVDSDTRDAAPSVRRKVLKEVKRLKEELYGANSGSGPVPASLVQEVERFALKDWVTRSAGERKADPEDELLWETTLDEAREKFEGSWPSPPASQWATHRYNEQGGKWIEKTAESKYKEKKKVPKADGSGTTTVYVYGPRQIANRNKEKAERVEKLRHSMKDLRKQVHDDLDAKDDKTRLTALAIALIDATFERVGNDDSADEGHFGVTGWLKKHLTFGKGKATIKYVGKSGVKHEKVVDDANLVKALRGCCEDKSPDDPILSFGSEDAEGPVKITSRDVNAYLKPFDVTAKDLRGFHANREMQEQLRSLRKKGPELPKGRKDKDKILKDEFKKALEATAEAVGHEASTLRTQYLVPGLEDAFMKDGTVIDNLKDASVERVVTAWFQRVATKTQGEREEAEAERLVRQSPSKKPSRDDSKRERMKVQDDPDVDGKDKDLSLNYKDTGG